MVDEALALVQAAYRGRIDIEQPRDLGLRPAVIDHFQRLTPLLRVQRKRPTESHAVGLRPFAALGWSWPGSATWGLLVPLLTLRGGLVMIGELIGKKFHALLVKA
jgi:hypothetical protein